MIDFLLSCIDFVLHFNVHLADLVSEYGLWVYGILFLIVFAETGLVITPFLPGDSLLFAAGSLSAMTILSPHFIVLTLIGACLLGDNLNYWIGRFVGQKLVASQKIKPAHVNQAHTFYQKYGAYAIFLARFIPIVRTFIPFTAGISRMSYGSFVMLSFLASCVWVVSLVYLGFYCGNFSFVKEYFSQITMAIIVISLSPLLIKMLKFKLKNWR